MPRRCRHYHRRSSWPTQLHTSRVRGSAVRGWRSTTRSVPDILEGPSTYCQGPTWNAATACSVSTSYWSALWLVLGGGHGRVHPRVASLMRAREDSNQKAPASPAFTARRNRQPRVRTGTEHRLASTITPPPPPTPHQHPH